MFFTGVSNAEVLTLSEGLRLAIERNRVVKITEAEELIAESDTLIRKARMFPEINASLSQTLQAHQPAAKFDHQILSISEKDFLSYSLSVQQTLYDFKGNSSRFGASKAILMSKKYDTKRVKNLVALDFLRLYFDLLEAEKMIAVSEKEAQRLESHLRDARHLYEEGTITKNDVLQAEVRISDARQRLLAVKNQRALTASRVNNALSFPLTSDIQVADEVGISPDRLDLNLPKAWETAEEKRPEISFTDEILRSLDLEKTSLRSEYFPRFFLRGSYDYTENRFQVHEDNWSLTLGMNINLYQGGSTRASIMKLENQKEQLLEQRKKLIDEIKLEVERYLLDLRNARDRIAVTETAIQQAEENLRINKVKYEEGVGTATDVVDAVTLLTIAETNYYRALYDLRRAEGSFLYATGEDLTEVYQ
ncbi:MAG: TolC family protein [Nitrospirota bacterium]